MMDMSSEGGRKRPSFFMKRMVGGALCLALLLALAGETGEAQRRFRGEEKPLAAGPGQDPAAVALLQKMLGRKPDYSGEQVTERMTEQGTRQSRQTVRGDRRGRFRMDFLEPRELAGDVVMIFPHLYRYYHKDTNVLDVAMWPNQREMSLSGQERRIGHALHRGLIEARKVGEEQIAGRQAGIVQLAGRGAGRRPGIQTKLWLDMETGVKLKQEVSGPRGLVSRSYFTRIVIGPAADVDSRDFEPSFLNSAKVNPLFPREAQRFDSVAEVRARVPFPLLEPRDLPRGFRLATAWVFPAFSTKGEPAALLRYTDGVAHFNLYQRRARGGSPDRFRPERQKVSRRSIQRWLKPTSEGLLEIVYIGHLAEAQVRDVFDSLR